MTTHSTYNKYTPESNNNFEYWLSKSSRIGNKITQTNSRGLPQKKQNAKRK